MFEFVIQGSKDICSNSVNSGILVYIRFRSIDSAIYCVSPWPATKFTFQ
jgi:hypothetical protein